MLLSHLDSYISTRLVLGKQSPSDSLSDLIVKEKAKFSCTDRPDMAWTSRPDALAEKRQFDIKVQTSNVFYRHPSLEKTMRLNVLSGRNVPLKRDGGTPQSPLASGLRAPFLPCYNKMSTCQPG